MPQRDVISWTAMIGGYVQNGFVEKALQTFKQMRFAGVKPDFLTFPSMFDNLPQTDVIAWTAMFSGYAENGFYKDALKFFESMKHSGTLPNAVSFASVLLICSNAGLVDEGLTYFNHMNNHYGITPTVNHYVCMVDLIPRAGYLEETLNFIIKMPVKPVVLVWTCFLGACRSHMNIGLGVYTATLLFDLDPKKSLPSVLLSKIYAEVGWWDECQMVRRLMKDRGIKKIPGCSWIEAHKTIHTFFAGDRVHPDTLNLCKVGETGSGDEGSRIFSRFKTVT
ncbi:pentatricopeptide repeat-containing protein At2g03880, mitochondrial [Cryptomeria japonica]|uniref:pentatricopeptide repeat-containing protein At2g03880, mitochondrial n=1 Tax=Cryptomeria japonica TaxID=3369 RepID=UPI0027D9DF0E|nr:pentatricopeptide repeat-containing protein At2g03880, mitochondrial [Cryptomeria japonica]